MTSNKPSSSDDEVEKQFMHDFTGWVYCLVGLQAGGGMLVAAVIKYADNVLKGLAMGVSVVVATGCSMALFGTPLMTQFTLAGSQHYSHEFLLFLQRDNIPVVLLQE
eukprot:scaffold218119_cov61-Attheya_sp.AAC.3